MKNKAFLSYVLAIIFFVQTCGIQAIPIFSATSSITLEEKRRLKKLDYYASLAALAWSTGEFDSYKKVPGAIANVAVTDLVCKGLAKYSGIKDTKWVTPYMPFLVLGGKQLIKYGVDACKTGYAYKDDLQKRYGNAKWVPYFLMGILLPYIMRKEITRKMFGAIDEKTGLTQIQYPQFVLSSTILTLLAWHMHEEVINWCGGMIQSLYDFFVPETRTQKYLRIKGALASMARSE